MMEGCVFFYCATVHVCSRVHAGIIVLGHPCFPVYELATCRLCSLTVLLSKFHSGLHHHMHVHVNLVMVLDQSIMLVMHIPPVNATSTDSNLKN